MPDARVIGRLSDSVLLVTWANHTTRDAAVAARERFGEDKTRVLGTILNDWDPKLAPNGYYGYLQGLLLGRRLQGILLEEVWLSESKLELRDGRHDQ